MIIVGVTRSRHDAKIVIPTARVPSKGTRIGQEFREFPKHEPCPRCCVTVGATETKRQVLLAKSFLRAGICGEWKPVVYELRIIAGRKPIDRLPKGNVELQRMGLCGTACFENVSSEEEHDGNADRDFLEQEHELG